MNIHKSHSFILGLIFLVFSFISLYPMWHGAEIWNRIDNSDEFINKYELPLDIVAVLYAMVFILVYNVHERRELVAILIYTVFHALSIIINGRSDGYFSIIAVPLIYILLSNIKNSYHYNWNEVILCALLVWIVAPIIDCFIFSDYSRQISFFTEFDNNSLLEAGFSGYAQHKNVYAYIVGLCFIITLFTAMPKLLKFFMIIVLSGACILSLCKSVMVTLVAITLYYKYKNSRNLRITNKHKIVFICLTFIATVVFFKLSFFDDPNRMVIINGFINVIKNNFLFGTGEATLVPSIYGDELQPAHNFILQGIADRGIIAFIIFMYYIKLYFDNSDSTYRLFLLYMLFNGLFQPYFSMRVPNHLMMVTFLLPFFLKKPQWSNSK